MGLVRGMRKNTSQAKELDKWFPIQERLAQEFKRSPKKRIPPEELTERQRQENERNCLRETADDLT